LCLFLAARLLKTAHNRQSSQQVTRRFPPPWSVEELDACFVVRDHNVARAEISQISCAKIDPHQGI